MVKHTIKLGIIIMLAWLMIPTGDPTDFFIPGIVAFLGMQLYILITTAIIIYLYMTIPGKTLTSKLSTVHKEIRGVFR